MIRFAGLYHLVEVRRRFGVWAGLQSLVYGICRRLLRLRVYHVVVAETTDAVTINDKSQSRFLAADEVRCFAEDPCNDLDKNIHRRLNSGKNFCLGTIFDGRLVSYSWFAVDSIEGEHACGSLISFPPKVAYFYKAFTLPKYRGLGIHQSTLLQALRELHAHGIRQVFGLVEVNNLSSLKSCFHAGFRQTGRLIAVGRESSSWSWLTGQSKSLGICVGRNVELKARGTRSS